MIFADFDRSYVILLGVRDHATASVVKWSEFLATDPVVPGSIPGHYKKKVVDLERGPLSLVSTTEELLDRKVATSV
jgi:hypothetical protein